MVQRTALEPTSVVQQIMCDRCGTEAARAEVEFQEMTSIGFGGGYGSIFGDGTRVEIDICQRCLSETLGAWLRVKPAADQRILRKLSLFDPAVHGGEFPASAPLALGSPAERAHAKEDLASSAIEGALRGVDASQADRRYGLAMHPRTYLSFWHIETSNLPVGTFRRRVLSTAEARSMVNSARESGALVCVAKEDLGAPYCEGARERHRELCAALRANADIEIHLKDFFGENCANPLCLAEIGGQGSLLIVDCHYAFDDEIRPVATAAGTSDTDETFKARARLTKDMLKMSVAPDSIKFYVFEQVEPAKQSL